MTLIEPQAMREIHEVRERLYEEEKDWTSEQRLAFYNKAGKDMAAKLGLRIAEPHRRVRTRKAG